MSDPVIEAETAPGTQRPTDLSDRPRVGDRIDVTRPGEGLIFDGVGALSNSSSRLLLDYPEPERSQILDYLFLPRYGAALQLLKLEIGADTNSTVVAEPSHLRTPEDFDPTRGWNVWIAREALARNPDLRLAGLMWGAPAWVSMWSDEHVRYLIRWLDGMAEQGLTVHYLGGGNEWYEPRPRPDFFVRLKAALASTYPHVRVVATDGHTPPDYWWMAEELARDPKVADAIDILGEHDVCVWRSEYRHAHVSTVARELAARTGKPLWNSEQSTQDAEAGAPALARAMNRHYIDARITANLNWSAVAAYYGNTGTGGTGLMVAEWPWSGYYRVGASVWVDAHTTQFTAPGWRYVDRACGYTAEGASVVGLRSEGSEGSDGSGGSADATIVVETVDLEASRAKAAYRLVFPKGPVHVRRTDLRSADPDDWFVDLRTRPLDPAGELELEVEPGCVYTVSTLAGGRGTAAPRAERASGMPAGFAASFERTPEAYVQDLQGAWEAEGGVLRQVVAAEPVPWHASRLLPTAIVGDPRWWGDYAATVSVRLAPDTTAELLGRVEYYDQNVVVGYRLALAGSGAWELVDVDHEGRRHVLASGTLAPGVGGVGGAGGAERPERQLGLEFRAHLIVASIDRTQVAEVYDRAHTAGQVGLATGGWYPGGVPEFRGLTVTPVSGEPAYAVPADGPSARAKAVGATSARLELSDHHTSGPERIVDGRPETRWRSAEPLPQAVWVDLGSVVPVHGVVYRPPVQGPLQVESVTSYAVEVAAGLDGSGVPAYRRVAVGRREPGPAAEVVALADPVEARWVRLVALQSPSGVAAVAGLDVCVTPVPATWPRARSEPDDPA